MKTNIINIQKGTTQLHYGVEYVENSEYLDSTMIRVTPSQHDDHFRQFVYSGETNLIRNTNEWTVREFSSAFDTDIPDSVALSSFNIYFPQHSVETYIPNSCLYAVELSTYIYGNTVVLGSYLIDRRSAIAYEGFKEICGRRFCECVELLIPDPWNITYSDEWLNFRQIQCHEPPMMNNTGSLLTVSIYPVYELENGRFRVLDGYTGGSNVIALSGKSDSLRASLGTVIASDRPAEIQLDLLYNESYSSASEYLLETYFFARTGTVNVIASVALRDKEEIYNYYETSGVRDSYVFSPDGYTEGTIDFSGWTKPEDGKTVQCWKEGLYFSGCITVTVNDEPFVSVLSNPVPLTQKDFAVMLRRPSDIPVSVDLEDIDPINNTMNAMNDLNIVNKVKNEIVQITPPNDFKNNLIRPVFIRVQKDSSEIVLHRDVTENVAISLSEYKSKVARFTLKAGGFEFPEIGRMGNSVIFKVTGELLNSAESGTYYILDDNRELITTGKYTI